MPYLVDGEEVEVVEQTSVGVIVRRMFGDDIEGGLGDPEIVPQVFEKAPTERKAKEIAELEGREEALRERIRALDRQVRDREAAEKRFLQFANQNQALTRISDFLSGRITHYLVRHPFGAIEVQDAVNGAMPVVSDRGRCDGETKLLSLFGKSGRDLQWKVNEYYDGSGWWYTVEPFTSRESALARLQEIVNAFEDEKEHLRERLYNAAVKYSLQVPAKLREFISSRELKAAEGTLNEARKKVSDAEQALGSVRAKWQPESATNA